MTNDKKKKKWVRAYVDEEVYEILKIKLIKQKISMQSFILKCIEKYLKSVP